MLACSGWLLVGCYGVLGGCHVHAGVLCTVSMTGVFWVVVTKGACMQVLGGCQGILGGESNVVRWFI